MAAQDAAVDSSGTAAQSGPDSGTGPQSEKDSAREHEVGAEQSHLDRVYRRLEEKIHEAEFLMADAARRGQVGTPGALAERDAQVFRAGVHLSRLNNEFEDFLFGRIDLLAGKDGKKGADGAYTSVEPADGAVRDDGTADVAETLHIGRIGVLDADYAPLVIDWRAPAAAPFYRSTPVDPGRVVRRRVIRSKGRRVLGVEDDLMRPEITASLEGAPLAVIGDGALMAALGQARGHTMRDIVSSIQAEQDLVIRAPAASVTEVSGGPGTGKTAVALHRAAYLLYQDRRRYAGGILVVSPTPLLVAYTEGVLPSLGEEGQVAIRALGSLVDGAEATAYDEPPVARIKGSARMTRVLRRAARGALERENTRPPRGGGAAQDTLDDLLGDAGEEARPPVRTDLLRVVAFGRRLELEADELQRVRQTALGGAAPVNLLRPRARKLLLDALWAKSGAAGRADDHLSRGDAELAAELRSGFDEDVSSEDAFVAFLDAWWPELTPRRVLAAMADERRLGRWARRILTPGETRRLARSLRRSGPEGTGPLSVHDVALLDELEAVLGSPPRPRRQYRELDPLDGLSGLEELMPQREETQRERAERLAAERTEYAHVIVDEAQDLTPMQWRMVGRRGRTATWTVVGDPAQSSWPDQDEAAEARDEALGSRPRRRFTLTVNYRNPAEIAELAAKVLALAMPGAESPRAVRSTGVRPRFRTASGDALGRAVREETRRLLERVDGTVGVVVAMGRREEAARWLQGLGDRVVALGSLEAKGLEYDATVLVSPAEIAAGSGRDDAGAEASVGLRVLYVALTRATQQLTVVATDRDEPDADGVPDLLRD